MRTKGPARVLVLALAFGLLPALAVLVLPAMTAVAHHEPTTQDVLDVATNPDGLGMECHQNGDEQDCDSFNREVFRVAFITPAGGPLKKVVTQTRASQDGPWFMPDADRQFMTDLQSVGCVDDVAVRTFIDEMVESVNNPDVPNDSYGPRTVGECSLFGELAPQPNESTYWTVESTLLPSAFSPTPSPTLIPTATPSPTPVPTTAPSATPRVTAVPTATPRPTPRVTARPTATATATATASPSPTPTPTPTATASPSPSPTPEQTVAGIIFTPEPSVAQPAPAGDDGGWARTVPVAKDVSTTPATLAGSALAALLLLLAMGFIGELFNNTFEGNYDRITTWWKTSWLGRAGKAFSGLWGGGS